MNGINRDGYIPKCDKCGRGVYLPTCKKAMIISAEIYEQADAEFSGDGKTRIEFIVLCDECMSRFLKEYNRER